MLTMMCVPIGNKKRYTFLAIKQMIIIISKRISKMAMRKKTKILGIPGNAKNKKETNDEKVGGIRNLEEKQEKDNCKICDEIMEYGSGDKEEIAIKGAADEPTKNFEDGIVVVPN